MAGTFVCTILASLLTAQVAPPLQPARDRTDTLASTPTAVGNAPIQLVLDPAVGTTQTIELTLSEVFKTWDNDKSTYDATLPTRKATIVFEVLDENLDEDTRTISYRIESVEINEDAFVGTLPDSFKQASRDRLAAFRQLSGISGTFTLHAMGYANNWNSQLPAGADSSIVDPQLNVVTSAISSLIPAMPDTAVGPGAKWSIQSLDKLGSSSVRWPIAYELTAQADDALHFSMQGETYIDVTVEKLPELGDNAVNKKAERRYAISSSLVHNPRLPVPSQASSALVMKLDAEYTEGMDTATFRSESTITTTIRELQRDISFRPLPLSPEDTIAQGALEGTILDVMDDGTADGDPVMLLDYPAGQDAAEVIFTTSAAQVSTGSDPTGGVLAPVRCLFDINTANDATTWDLREYRIVEEGQPAEAIDNLEKMMRTVVGKSMRHPTLEGKIHSKATQFGDVLAGPTQPNMLLEITNLWKPPLPFDPVAKGARWNFARPWIDSETGAAIWQGGEATLIDVTEDSFTIEYKSSFSLLDDSYALGERYLRDLKSATLTSFDAGLRARVTWKQGAAAPLEGEAVFSQRAIADVANSFVTGTATNLQSWKAAIRRSAAFTDAPAPAIAPPTIESLSRLTTDASRATFADFKLHSVGDEPRARVAYNLPADHRDVYCLTVRQFNAQSNGTRQQSAAGPTMNFVLSLGAAPTLFESATPTDPDQPAFRNLRWEFLEGFITLDADATEEQKSQALQYEALFAPLAGASGICSLQPTGEITFEATTPPMGGLPTEEQSLRELHEWIGRIFQALPKDAIGPGASWSRRIDASLANTNYPLTMTTVAGARSGDTIELSSTGEVTQRDRFLSIPNLPATRSGTLIEGTATRTTSASLDPRFIAPVSWSWSDTTQEQRAIRESGRVIDWLFSHNQTLASMKHWPDYTQGSATRPQPPLLPAFDEVTFPARPQ